LQDLWKQKVADPVSKTMNSFSNIGSNISNAADQLGQGNFSNAYNAMNGVNPNGQQSSGSGLQGSSSGWNFTSSLGD
jgi:phage-related protein